MSSATFAAPQPAATVSSLLDQLLKNYSGPPFGVRFWDGALWRSQEHDPDFIICLRSDEAWHTLSKIPDELSLGTQYVEGNIDVEGDLYLALRALPFIESSIRSNLPAAALALREYASTVPDHISRLLHFGTMHSQKRDAASISHHYDRPAEFYELFLGPSMVYSCAYFRSWQNTLEAAQYDKLDLICRKLDLQPGERFLDIGCGWGSLVLHARQHYGVLSHGVSLSQQQIKYATKRIEENGEKEHCQVSWSDFRDIDKTHTQFSKLASVGMCEHVGRKNMESYFAEAYKILAPEGLFLNHGITSHSRHYTRQTTFIDQYVFPDSELLTLTEIIAAAEKAGFEVRDVEDLREHYEETLHRWGDSLAKHKDEVIALTDEKAFRVWRLYMAGCAESFRRGDIGIYQVLLSKNDDNGRSSATKLRKTWYENEGVS